MKKLPLDLLFIKIKGHLTWSNVMDRRFPSSNLTIDIIKSFLMTEWRV